MKIFDKEFKECLRTIFIKGKTEMGVVWLLFIFGLIIGLTLK